MSTAITIKTGTITISDCETVIVAPEIALQEAGYIKTFTVKDSGNSKHEYHALAQMAYFQYQDDELEIVEINNPLTISCGHETHILDDGMVLYRQQNGSFQVLIHVQQNRKKLLEAVYRYCTRWVRLDI